MLACKRVLQLDWSLIMTTCVTILQLHVALEYSVPHLGHNSSLMYGGLGKMVDIFIRYSDRYPSSLLHSPVNHVLMLAALYIPSEQAPTRSWRRSHFSLAMPLLLAHGH